ncbi:MAG: hypothetical protein E3J67_02955 [Dehalococcoidia bacterium]|nr:MAG: hypothetical protein E3J67_02955 [Dehalococcoidia bacterium]
MKKKIYKIMGVALTLVMVLSLFAFTAAPVAADPDENEWSKFDYPDEGSDGDWFYSPDIEYVGPMARAINGDLYAYAYVEGADFGDDDIDSNIFKSDDGGRTWSTTDFADELFGGDPGFVVDIVCDSEDADIVYVATGFPWWPGYAYWSEDGGDSFEAMAPDSLDDVRNGDCITSLDVSYFGDDPHVFVSTSNWGGGGGVYYINLESYLSGWIDMGLWAYEGSDDYDAFAVNAAPDFDDSRKVYALVCYVYDDGPTRIVVNSGTSGVWEQFGEDLEEYGDGDLEIEWGSNICFPDDFDHDELFVAVDGGGDDDGEGSIYRVTDETAAYCLADDDDDVYADFISLEITGDVGATLLLAGTASDDGDDYYYEATVLYSTDDGESWDAAGKRPSGYKWTYVLMAEDFADSGEAWAATSGRQCGVSYTIDGGDLFNQISLINTDMGDRIRNVSFYPDYEDSGKLFLASKHHGRDSLWRYDGEYWERVAEERVLGTPIRMVSVSPEIGADETVFFTNWEFWDSEDIMIYYSDDEGQSWDDLRCQPGDLYNWVVIDAETILAGGVDAGDGVVWKTDRHGARVWEDVDADIEGEIWHFAVFGDNVLCGSDEGEVAISEDLGDEWEMVGDPLDAEFFALVAFDTEYDDNSFIYAACNDDIYRFEVGESDDWEEIVFDADGNAFNIGIASGIATADGCLYVSDAEEGAGMWRSVDPTADEPLFEQVDFELNDYSMLWWLQTTSGSNVLYALDMGYDEDEEAGLDNVLWTYEDALVGPVELESPADGVGVDRTNKLTLEWEGLDDADDYEVRCYADEDFKTAYKVFKGAIGGDEPVLVLTEGDGIESGTEYWWKVRVAESEPLVSKWSVVWSTTTAMGAAQWNPFSGPVNEYPWMGATDVPLAPTFAWNTADWATGYEFELADNDAFTDAFTKSLTTTVYQYETDLTYFTTYFWKVRAVSATGTSNWATGVFTTMERPAEIVEPPPPVEIPPLPAPITPAWIWAIVVIGAVLVIAVIVLIVMTRRVP